jgi:hypothetical protein
MRPLIAQSLAGMAQVYEAAGDITVAAEYDIQARQLFDDLGCRRIRQCVGSSSFLLVQILLRCQAAHIVRLMSAFNAIAFTPMNPWSVEPSVTWI